MIDMVQRVVNRVRTCGDLPAVVTPETITSYSQLYARMNEVADLMRTVGPRPGDRFIVPSRHTVDVVALYLACIDNGWVYVPLPESTPARRQAEIEEAVRPAGVIHRDPRTSDLSVRRSGAGRVPEASPGLLAILHTSGSTGRPKSVKISRRNLDDFLLWCARSVPLRDEDSVASFSPLHFDLCTHDLFHTLGSAARLVFPSPDGAESVHHCADLLAKNNVTRLYMVPTYLERVATHLLSRDRRLTDVRTVMFAGERLTHAGRSAVEQAFPRARLLNLYGPIRRMS